MYRSILVPLDGSPWSEQALPFARNIARWAGANLDLAHIHTLPMAAFMDGTPIIAEDDDVRRASELAYLTELAQRQVGVTDHDVTATLLDGPIADTLIHHALAMNADLMVMTTHGRGTLSRFWLGSVADRLVRQAPMPVLLIRPTHEAAEAPRDPTFSHVLIPLDGSQLAEHIIEHARALGAFTHARYTLLQVVEPVLTYPAMSVGVYDEQILYQMRSAAQSYLDGVAAALRVADMETETEVLIGAPAPVIIDYVERHEVDLIAMGTHGRSGMSRLLLGSVADKVVRAACAPVLLHGPCQPAESQRT